MISSSSLEAVLNAGSPRPSIFISVWFPCSENTHTFKGTIHICLNTRIDCVLHISHSKIISCYVFEQIKHSSSVLRTSSNLNHFLLGVEKNEDTIYTTVSVGSFRDYSNPEITRVYFSNSFYINVN